MPVQRECANARKRSARRICRRRRRCLPLLTIQELQAAQISPVYQLVRSPRSLMQGLGRGALEPDGRGRLLC